MEPAEIKLWPCDSARSAEDREAPNLFPDGSYRGRTLGAESNVDSQGVRLTLPGAARLAGGAAVTAA
jgi:hypothetical protein